MALFFFTAHRADAHFSEPPRRADSKIPFSFIFLPNFGSGSPLGPGGQSRYDFGGGGGGGGIN